MSSEIEMRQAQEDLLRAAQEFDKSIASFEKRLDAIEQQLKTGKNETDPHFASVTLLIRGR